jgi:hypothetical protein
MSVLRHTTKLRKEDLSAYLPNYASVFATKTEVEDLKVQVEYLKKHVESGLNEESELELCMPRELFERLPRDIQKTIEGVELCFKHGHADFCLMGIRKILSTAIHIRFKKVGKERELYDSGGEPFKLPKWIELAKQNGFISASLAKKLTNEVKVFGDVGSHDYMITFYKGDVSSIFSLLRLALDRMYPKEDVAKAD